MTKKVRLKLVYQYYNRTRGIALAIFRCPECGFRREVTEGGGGDCPKCEVKECMDDPS